MAVTKLVERYFISDLALVSSPGVACGFRYDPIHCEYKQAAQCIPVAAMGDKVKI